MTNRVSETERKYTEYSLRVRGLFGRNRKVKAESFKLLEGEPGVVKTPDEVKPSVEAKLAEIKAKPGTTYEVVFGERTETLTKYDDGVTLRSVGFWPMSERALYAGAVGAA